MIDWRPTASQESRHCRAQLLFDIRVFFSDRDVLEVDTPVLSQHTVTDVYIQSFQAVHDVNQEKQAYYLQTSPEYAMKRLLASGSGSIYQIAKAFRSGERGRQHNPEFTLLEWYRVHFDHHQLMDEMDSFLQQMLGARSAYRMSYQALWEQRLGVDPLHCEQVTLQTLAKQYRFQGANQCMDRDALLQFLFSVALEPHIGWDAPCFVYDFPASQAGLAKIAVDTPEVAQRFEVYVNGLELANGFCELQDSQEQALRFKRDLAKRRVQNLPMVEMDQRFLAALEAGLPDCSGVALGIERLLMLKMNTHDIREVMDFPWKHA